MTTTTIAPAFRYIGITDECVVCEKCGKPGLKSTVILAILDADGNPEGDPTYYGSTCAAKALAVKGGGRAVLQSARWAHHTTIENAKDALRMLAHYGLPEAGEPTADEIREAMKRYIRQHPGIAEHVTRTGVGVRARVLDMLSRKRAAIAEAALIGA